jgi:outer membrane protein assembly factor BamC
MGKKMVQVIRVVGVMVVALAVSACGTLDQIAEDSKIDYRSSRQRSTLDLPPDIASPRSDERFNVPNAANSTLSGQQARSATAARDPSKAEVLPQAKGMRVERAGSQRWLVVEREPAKAYEFVREFWLDSGFVSALDSPQTGVFETDWAENRAKLPKDFIRSTIGKVFENAYSTSERDKFRTRIEPGANGTTEIYVSHRGMIEVYSSASKDSTVWQARPIDADLEAEMLQRMIVRFGASQEQAKTTVAASQASAKAAEKARMQTVGTAKQLQLDEPFDRAWRRVGLSLDRSGFTVEDRDRSQGVFFVRYVDPEVEAKNSAPTLWGRITGNKPDVIARQFRIRLAAEGSPPAGGQSNTLITVQDKEGKTVAGIEQQLSERILERLRDDLK